MWISTSAKRCPFSRDAQRSVSCLLAAALLFYPCGLFLSADEPKRSELWSIQPLRKVQTSELRNNPWCRNPIDNFILAKLREKSLEPSSEATRAVYLRRVKCDLLGLPPTPQEIDAFVNDQSADAYEKLIDRLLASSHYGERWGRHWLDVVRFGESDGFENDRLREHAWRYRDYVIQSFNLDKPYPQFVKEQLAGDVLEPITHDGIVASGFLVAGPWDEIQNVAKSPTEKKRAHEEQMEDIVAAVGQTFLGMTVHCARCHDHKFDPIPQTDYYRLKAVFDGVDHGNRPLFTPAEQKAHDAKVGPLQARLQKAKSELEQLNVADGLTGRIEPKALVEGRFGKALDGRHGRVSLKSKPEYHAPPFTVECWAKLDSKKGFNILVANNRKESSEHWELYSYAGSGEFSAYFPGFQPAEIKSGVDITDGQWHYVAMPFDGKTVRLFVDAKLVKEVGVTRHSSGGTIGLIHIGAYPPQNIGCDGLVDEVRISRGVRLIERLPEAAFAFDDQTLALWHLDTEQFEAPSTAATTQTNARLMELQREVKTLDGEIAKHPVGLTYAGVQRQPEPTVVYLRGDIKKPGPQVSPGGLSAIRIPSAEFSLTGAAPEAERRRKFAEWVVHPENPLTARVLVNRVWHYHFGQGLVDTPSDFGSNGGKPSHPDLLDWLTRDFIDQGWSIKKLHKRIMLSATYRQSSKFNPRAAEVDADNRLLWRFNPRRLEAEIVRDAMLAVSGELNPKLGGPSFRPFILKPQQHNFYEPLDKDDPEFNRRSVYRMNVNTGRNPLLDALDCPAPSLTMPKRRSTTTPIQALALMNDSFVLRQAKRLAARVKKEAGDDVAAQVTLAHQLALGRMPTTTEQVWSARLAEQHGLPSLSWALLNASEFLCVE